MQTNLWVKPNISQSLLKDFTDYYEGNNKGCGEYLKRKHYMKMQTPTSEAQLAGQYFEYLATGYAKDKTNPPTPLIVNVGKKNEGIAKTFLNARQSAELFKQMIEFHKIKILSAGDYWKHEDVSGIIDILAEWNGEKVLIDLKQTALFDNKWDENGWETESLPYKAKMMLQPIHYKYLARHILGIYDIPFFFFVFSSREPEDAKIIKTNIQEEHINLHESITISKIRKYLEYHFNNPDTLEPRPTYMKCKACPYNEACPFKSTFPEVEEIYY